MSLQLGLLPLPDFSLTSFNRHNRELKPKQVLPPASIPSSDYKEVLLSVDIVPSVNIVLCDIRASSSHPDEVRLVSTFPNLAWNSRATRVRLHNKNILRVLRAPTDVHLVRSIFQVARDLLCSHVLISVRDARDYL